MPRLKQTKLQGFQAFVCHHPIAKGAPYDDMGRARCPRCGWRVCVVMTRKRWEECMRQAGFRST